MSLLLRHDCQGALDAIGLDMLHVEVRDKTLCVVGECGQTIVTVNGIQCSSNISNKEVAYAVALFDKFLAKNAKDLIKFIKAKKASVGMVQPTYGNYTFKNETNYTTKPNSVTYYLNLDNVTVRCIKPHLNTKKAKLTFSDLDYRPTKQNTLDGIRVLLDILDDEQIALLKAFQELNDYFVIINELDTLRTKLSTCSI